jgi:hypothetical protein
VPSPLVFALSTYEASLGTLVEVYGEGFPDPSQGDLSLRFEGTYETESGDSAPVSFESEVSVIDRATARWTRFGPFAVPFDPTGRRLGTFEGTVRPVLELPDGTRVDGEEALAIRFVVQPSVLIHDLQPISASCAAPAIRALGGATYRMRVEALGFEPESFNYTLSAPGIGMAPQTLRRLAEGRFDDLTGTADFTMPDVPEDVAYFVAVVTVQGVDAAGSARQSSFAIGVHRPLEVFYDGNVQVAEVYAATPVTGCIPGGESGRQISYTETMTEIRSRGFNTHWDENWLRQHTVSVGTSTTVGVGESNGVGFSTTDGTTFNWSLNGSVEGSIPIFQAVKATFSAGIGGGTSRSQTGSVDQRSDINASETTTDTTSETVGTGGSSGETFTWDVSSHESISRTFGGNVYAHTYGVFYRQTSRLLRRAQIVTYNQCGSALVVGQVDFTDWTWAPDLALGPMCPPLPESNFEPASCFIAPCSGE